MNALSSHRLHQSAWTIVSIYVAILVAGIVKDALIPLILDPARNALLWWIAIPTVALNLLTAFEAYLWLTPPRDRPVSRADTRYIAARLVIYLLAVIAQMLLLEACTSRTLSIDAALSIWAAGMSVILGLYFLYNLVGLLWRNGQSATHRREFRRALVLYGASGLAFALLAAFGASFGTHAGTYAAVLAAIAGVYFCCYVLLWRSWYAVALSSEGEDGGETF